MSGADITTMSRAQLMNEVRALRKNLAQLRAARARAAVYSVEASPVGPALAAAGWSQRQLAQAIGCTQANVSRWVLGDTRVSKDRAREIVAVFLSQGAEPPAFEMGGEP